MMFSTIRTRALRAGATMLFATVLAAIASLCASPAVLAADYPAPKEGTFVARNFRFHTGDVLPELKIGYVTIGDPSGEPVLILHGTTASSASMLTPEFAGALFGPDQPLDARRYFIIIPDSIGVGRSSKPSDGLKGTFPRYNYADMVDAQYRLVTEGLGLRHLRLVLGYSMGGMHAWLWGTQHPDFTDAIVPMAAQPAPMSGRNWMMRRMVIDAVRNDPAWNNGNYTEQPQAFRIANVFFGIATTGGTLALQAAGPDRAAADKVVDSRLAALTKMDANDYLYQWDASADYDPSADLGRISAPVLAISSADDERNPPETGIMEAGLKRVPQARLVLIPTSPATRGHGTTVIARLWSDDLRAFLASAPKRPQ